MFHSRVLGAKSRNLDPFFTDRDTTRMLLAKNGRGCRIAVMEGVMGYYDGLSETSSKGGASDLAAVTGTPVLAGSGMLPAPAAPCWPLIKGFLDFQQVPLIRGVI